MMLLGGIAAFREVQRKHFTYGFVIVMWGHLGLLAGRNVPIFMLLAAPIVAKNLGELVSMVKEAPAAGWVHRAMMSFGNLAAEVDETDRIPRIHLTSVLALGVVAALIYAPKPPEKFRADYDPKRYPAKALESAKLVLMGQPGFEPGTDGL